MGASRLLAGESSGLGIDFTGNAGLGFVTVKGHTTNYSNIPVDSFLTNSGTSPKLVLKADGTYGWSPHNLVTYSEDLTQWTNAAGTPVKTATTVQDDASGALEGVRSNIHTSLVGEKYTAVFWVGKDNDETRFPEFQLDITTGGAHYVTLNTKTGATGTRSGASSSGSAAVVDEGDRWRLTITSGAAQGTSASLYVYPAIVTTINGSLDTAAVGTVTVYKAQLNRGSTALTYKATTSAAFIGTAIEYDASTGKYYGLVEPQATNLLVRSQELESVSWAKGTSVTVTANDAIAPDGTLTADKITESDAGGVGQVDQGVSVAADTTTRTFSVFLKKDVSAANYTRLRMRYSGSSTKAASVLVSVATGLVVQNTETTNLVGSAVVNAGDYWRFSITSSNDGANTTLQVWIDASYNLDGTTGAAASATGSVWAWGAQLETGSVATSPIFTAGSTVTRAADNINVATSALPYSATEGTFVFNATLLASNNNSIFAISDGTGNERFALYNDAGTARVYVADGGAAQVGASGLAPGSSSALAANTRFKAAFAWAANDFAHVKDGGTAGTDGAGTLPTVNKFYFAAADGTGYTNYRVHSLVYLPRRATNTELQTKTAA